jgi:hypothetical protein
MLKLPASVTYTDGNARLPEEGLYLHGFAPDGEQISVSVRQRNIASLEYAGRLFVDSYLIQARSEDEAAVLALLAAAEFSEEPRGSVDHNPGPVTGRSSLERIRNLIVNYVQSDLYLDICKYGVKKKFQPWRGF